MWWREAVLYQIYPRSFADSNGDGIGDLRGVTEHLDHLAWLGVDAIWLSPVTASPNTDWGYDVSDYCDIHPDLGSLDDFDDLVREAAARNIKVLNDLVPNHSSDRHEWFLDAKSSPDSAHRDWYVWADPKPDGSQPNNWVSSFGGPAWTLDDASGQYYLHNFLDTQPDLNWWNEDVRSAFDEILKFWFDRGTSGFRIDVCHAIVKDKLLRDNPPATDDDDPVTRLHGQRSVYNTMRPELHDVLRRWREIARSYTPERALVGETFIGNIDALPTFYGDDDELHLAFNIAMIFARLQTDRMSKVVEQIESSFPDHAWPCWTGSNHDVSRFPTRWAKGDERKIRCALVMLLTLRGTPVLYYGDEIGMQDRPFERSELKDPVGLRFHPVAGRDPERTPMQWNGGPGAGFTTADAKPWLPFGDFASCNVADQRGDAHSTLHLARDLIALRKAFRLDAYERVAAPESVWAYKRGRHVVVLNLSDDESEFVGDAGTVRLSTGRNREGQELSGGVSLAAWEGVVVESG